MTPAAFSGNYADIKTVKTRGVFQVIVEIKIEDYQQFVAAFGGPLPGSERPVALALLNTSPGQAPGSAGSDTGQQRGEAGKPQTERPRQHFSQMSRAQQAGILCNDMTFQLWLSNEFWSGEIDWATASKDAATFVRNHCTVHSRADLDASDLAAHRWDQLVSRYRTATGKQAEAR